MKPASQVVVLILLSAMVCAAQQFPIGTMLPVALRTPIRVEKAKVGERITGRLAQYVVLDSVTLPRGTQVTGRIVETEPGTSGSPSRVTVTFDTIRVNGHDVAIATTLRALASTQAVFDAQLPTNVINDFGSTIRDWNTVQVGGQAVYRGDGTVTEGGEVVGKVTPVGEVFGEPKTWSWSPCARDRASNTVQSFWVFSTDACGVYGFDGLRLAHAGRSEPAGQIVLESPGKLQIRGGSGFLLMVVPSAQQPRAARG